MMRQETYKGHTWRMSRMSYGPDFDRLRPFRVVIDGQRTWYRCASITQATEWARKFIDELESR